MKATGWCIDCLTGLADKTLKLSKCNDNNIFLNCRNTVNNLIKENKSPPDIANKLLSYIKITTGVYDPFDFFKEKELFLAKQVFAELAGIFPDSLEGTIQLSVLGNSLDFFADSKKFFQIKNFNFTGDMDKIKNEIYTKEKDVLIFGDNIGDFIFDMPLVKFLKGLGKQVFYAVKEHPVQNDLSMPDVLKYEFLNLFDNIISTGTDEVGIKRTSMEGKVKELWEQKSLVIAKGMGNYETISEYHGERPVIHIMKVKCPAVSQSVKCKEGTYIAKLY